MKKTVLIFGLLSGAVSSAAMLITLPFIGRVDFDHGAIFGYTSLVASTLLIFFGVRSYRERAGGAVTFGHAAGVGLAIALVSATCYVATWELIYFKFAPGFADNYAAYEINKAKARGATPEAIAAKQQEMRDFKAMYDKPLMNVAITFMEPLPFGVAGALISAAVLRRRSVDPRVDAS